MNLPVGAQTILTEHFQVSRETLERLEALVDCVVTENLSQNLISESTIATIWTRHVIDSAQLVNHVPATGQWLDLGTGAGFPGVVVALLRPEPIYLVESRRLRVDFLRRTVERLALSNVTVIGDRLERVALQGTASVISARAFAPLDKIFSLSSRFANRDTVWALHKGRRANEELAAVQRSWDGMFDVRPSITEPDAAIIVAKGVKPRDQT